MKKICRETLDAYTDEQKAFVFRGAGLMDAVLEGNPNDKADDARVTVTMIADLDQPVEEVTFYIVRDGDEIPDTFPGKYFKTARNEHGQVHVFFKPKALPQQRATAAPNDPAASSQRGR